MGIGAKALKDNLEAVYELAKRAANLELQEKIMGLREQVLEIENENLHLRLKNKELEEGLKLKEQLNFDGRIYWLHKENGSKEGPFCQVCKDKASIMTRLQSYPYKWSCLVCKNTYEKAPEELTDDEKRKGILQESIRAINIHGR